jgi:hypothetical protein
MPRPKAQVLGKRFGRLVVVAYCRDASGPTRVWCLCDCGEFSRVRPVNLRSGNSQSCGCLFREICHLPPADRALWPVAIAMEVRHAAA